MSLTTLRQRMFELAIFIASACIFLVLLFEISCHSYLIAPEAAMHLECAKQFLSGKELYVDVITPHPPMIVFLSCAPYVLQSLFSGFDICLIFSLLVWLISIISTGLLATTLVPQRSHREFYCFGSIVTWFCLIPLIIGPEFGTIQHFFLIFYMPYLCLHGLSAQGSKVSKGGAILAGCFAAVGLSLAWEFYFLGLAIEIWLIVQNKSVRHLRSPEVVALLAVTTFYLLSLAFNPQIGMKNYFQMIIPLNVACLMVWDPRLGFMNNSSDRRDVYLSFIAAVIFSLALAPKRYLVKALLIIGFFGIGFYTYLQDGYSCHLVLVMGAAAVIFAICSSTVVELLFASKSALAQSVMLMGTMVIGVAWFVATYDTNNIIHFVSGKAVDSNSPLLKESERFANENDSVLFLNQTLRPGYPLILQRHQVPASRWLYTYPVGLFALLRKNHDLKPGHHIIELGDQFFDQLYVDIKEHHPKFLAIEAGLMQEEIRFHDRLFQLIKQQYSYDLHNFEWRNYAEFQDAQKHNLETLSSLDGLEVYTRR